MGPGLILLETVLVLLLLLLGPPLVTGTESRLRTPPAAHFLYQGKVECRFANGTAGEVRFLERDFWDRQECVRFDSRLGRYRAISELCTDDERDYNRDLQWLENRRAQVDAFCRYSYLVMETGRFTSVSESPSSSMYTFFVPTVTISPTKGDPLAHHTLLICTAAGYYPQGVKITWLKNGQEQTAGVGYAEELQNADWTYQYQAMLETVPQRGDLYACQVEHSSRKEPITVQWEPQTSDSARSKVWTGAVGAVLGLVFVAVGLYLYLKSKKGEGEGLGAATPPPALESAH
ncbi:PREDICTED: H-2 class II histocompatibility antigen, E-S beta chain-like [Gekko japonicus]|uniref:H-2 class II histocompatibility antigen, E-S beta chain-like n=1 Tax=Gekko japonicus TaxID=146911 RepID=A0ABM1K7D7_GEKJA|nr:PREDICTED: H-2 class II histocompatibility antigen, E-S beta chain-like [Gekko japonicus]